MSDYYVFEDDGTSRFLLEDESGALIREEEPPNDEPTRASQLPVEAVVRPDDAFMRASQVVVESVASFSNSGVVSQLPVEVVTVWTAPAVAERFSVVIVH